MGFCKRRGVNIWRTKRTFVKWGLTLMLRGAILPFMVKPMKKKEAVKLLKNAGFIMRQGKGDHERKRRSHGRYYGLKRTFTWHCSASAGRNRKIIILLFPN